MKRLLAATVVVLMPIVIVAAAILYITSRGLPSDARAALEGYLIYRYDQESKPLVQQSTLATKPWLLTSQMSGPTFGGGAFFNTSVVYSAAATGGANWPSTPVASQGYYSSVGSLRALPYPPEEVWCVLLDVQDQGQTPILVAAHMDLYNARWIVHEMPTLSTPKEVNALLDEIGCGLNLGASQ